MPLQVAVQVPAGEPHLQVVLSAVVEGGSGQDLGDALAFECRRNDGRSEVEASVQRGVAEVGLGSNPVRVLKLDEKLAVFFRMLDNQSENNYNLKPRIKDIFRVRHFFPLLSHFN